MYIALLGRQPELSIAELERVYGSVTWFSPETATVKTSHLDVQRLGGTQKAGKIIAELPHTDWRRVSQGLVRQYAHEWAAFDGKITHGLSVYGFDLSAREVQKSGIVLKGKLKASGVSLRLVPNQEAALSTATSHHNKLGLSANKVELLIVRGAKTTIIAESVGAQNITALANRDQGRPRRDAFVGMLPPKLAQMMINYAVGDAQAPRAPQESKATQASQAPQIPQASQASHISQTPRASRTPQASRVLDPFCGTGVILQEAALLGYAVYGTDLAEKMIRYSRDNLAWFEQTVLRKKIDSYLHEGDATNTQWQQPITAVATEAYLGQPFSAPPSDGKLKEVRGTCNHIIGTFLHNLARQIAPGTPVVVAVPAWRSKEGTFTHLPLTRNIEDYGFCRIALQTVESDRLMYFRDDQVVAREILILTRS